MTDNAVLITSIHVLAIHIHLETFPSPLFQLHVYQLSKQVCFLSHEDHQVSILALLHWGDEFSN